MTAALTYLSGSSARPRGWGQLLCVAAVLFAVPVFAAVGLSLPLPVTVERIAANLVPFANVSALDSQASSAARTHGTIVLSPGERRSGAQPTRSHKTAPARRTSAKPTASHRVVAPVSAITAPAHEKPLRIPDEGSADPSATPTAGATAPPAPVDAQTTSEPVQYEPSPTQPQTTTTTTSGNGNPNPNAGGANAGGNGKGAATDKSTPSGGGNNGHGDAHGGGHSP